MSSSPTTLMGVGIPDKAANKLGNTIRTIAGVGTSQALGASLTVNQALLTTAGGATAFTLPTTWEVGDTVSVYNTSATAALIYPQSGGAIDGGSTNASVSVAQNASRTLLKASSTSWRSVQSSLTATAFTDITVDSITGTDASLGITGLADAQGGAVALVGGASSTSGNAGGAVTAVGGAAGATGAGGAVALMGAVGGATSGLGGAATIAGGAGTNGNAAGGVASLTGGAGQGSAAGGVSKAVGGAGGATGAGGAAQLTGGAGGATSGTGGAVNLTGGAGTNGNASGGDVVLTGGALNGSGKKGAIIHRGTMVIPQGAPTAKTVTAAISAAELVGGLITTTGVTAPSVHQLPTGTLIDAELPGIATGDAFDFSIINTGTGASDDATITVNTDVTIVGNPTIGALTDATIISGSGRFRARRSGANTYIVYRLA